VVEGTGLENRHTVYAVSRVRISPCPYQPTTVGAHGVTAHVVRGFTLTGAFRAVTLLSGWVAEWFKAHAWKACVRESVPRVRISPHPYAPFDVTMSGGVLSFRQIGLWCPFVVSVRAAPQASPLARREEFGARLHRPLRMSTTTPEARHAFVRDRGRLLFRHSPPPCSMSRPASGAHSP
jgi:hypothetical protein